MLPIKDQQQIARILFGELGSFNQESTRQRITREINTHFSKAEPFLLYILRCDEDLNSPEVIDTRELRLDIHQVNSLTVHEVAFGAKGVKFRTGSDTNFITLRDQLRKTI